MKIAVVVDSTSVIGTENLEKHENLFMIPLHVHIGTDSYKDSIDIQPHEFFKLMEQTELLPNTSQPSVGELLELFEVILKDYDQILYLTISSGISGTYQTGVLAQKEIDSDNIFIFDTSCTSVIEKHMTLVVLQMIKEGKNINDILNKLEELKENYNIYLVVDNLKHLARTGRVSNASATIGNMLKIKPILKFEEGLINLKEKIRTTKKAHQSILEIIKEEELTENSVIRIAHADGLDYAENLKKELLKIYPNHNIEIDELSPVISVHTGPKTLGLGWFK